MIAAWHIATAPNLIGSAHWFDAKGACVFPLVTDSTPTSRQQLIDALTAGWMKNLKFPSPDSQVVTADGGKYPSVNTLHMDLGGSRMDLTKDNKKTKPAGKVEGQLFVNDFELDGRPLIADRENESSFHGKSPPAGFRA